jgi:hypothetical protein
MHAHHTSGPELIHYSFHACIFFSRASKANTIGMRGPFSPLLSDLSRQVLQYTVLYYIYKRNLRHKQSESEGFGSPACICMPLNFGHHPRGFTVAGGYMFRVAVLRARAHMDPACH